MDFFTTIKHLDATTYRQLKTAIELRKWPDGNILTQLQIETCLEAILIYEHQHHIPNHERTGFLPEKDCRTSSNAKKDPSLPPITLIK